MRPGALEPGERLSAAGNAIDDPDGLGIRSSIGMPWQGTMSEAAKTPVKGVTVASVTARRRHPTGRGSNQVEGYPDPG